MPVELKAQAVIANDAVKADVVVRALDVTVLEGTLFAVGVFILKVPAALVRDTDLDAVLPVTTADVHPCALFAPRAKL